MTLPPQCYLPNHKSFAFSEALIWFRDGGFGGVIGKCQMPSTDIS